MIYKTKHTSTISVIIIIYWTSTVQHVHVQKIQNKAIMKGEKTKTQHQSYKTL